MEPEKIIQDTSERMLTTLRNDRQLYEREPERVSYLVDEVLGPHIDFELTCRLALGRHWRTATTDQRQRFMKEFKKLLVRTYATAFPQLSEWELSFLPLRMPPDATDVVVKTQILRAGAPPVAVDYRMRRKSDGWKAYDVSVEGVSLVTSYRSTFAQEIREHGLDGLIERLASHNRGNTTALGPPSVPKGGASAR